MRNLSPLIDSNSLRVSEAKGAATILEVSHNVDYLDKFAGSERQEELRRYFRLCTCTSYKLRRLCSGSWRVLRRSCIQPHWNKRGCRWLASLGVDSLFVSTVALEPASCFLVLHTPLQCTATQPLHRLLLPSAEASTSELHAESNSKLGRKSMDRWLGQEFDAASYCKDVNV